MSFLDLTNVRKEFANFTAVENFNLKVERGEFVSFLGPSGCGKTTTLRMIAGFEKPTSGQITINGKDITNVPANKRNVGMVFQSYALFPNLTVANNIGFGLKVKGEASDLIRQRVAEMLDLIHMQEFAGRYPHQLSGGQQQRVALARAIAIRPQVLLMDEPLSALDAKIRINLRQEIRAIQRQLGITTIYVTHDQEEALSISDRIVVMSKGKMEQVGTPLDIYNAPKTRFVASFVGTLNLLDAQVTDARNGKIKIDDQEIAVGQQIQNASTGKQVSVAIRPEAISLNGHSSTGNHLNGAVEDVSFLGSVVRVRVKLENQHVNFDTFNNPNLVPPAIGQPVSLTFMPEACMVVQDEK
ncbi:MAG: ABC transporter ATP-binding protein [Chloroflexi bacterium]|nr:ABC transporter ATP-binding protein [Chloroflexota bacterium]MCC6896137.1 ABC transporter ATP-binding protein [Anaerolineae bacterium]